MFQNNLLLDKRVLVTGGGSGLGKAMAARFLELGARVVICGRREEILNETVAEFAARFPQQISSVVCDIRSADAVEAMIAAIWSDGPLDALVNNAAGNFVARTETLSPRAVEWGGRGIRMNAVAPGVFPTKGATERLIPNETVATELASRNPLGRVGDPLELANVAAFLLSDLASFINGECLTVDGGECLAGAGQFNLLRRLSDGEWDALKPKRSS